jgi:hypothetical protein
VVLYLTKRNTSIMYASQPYPNGKQQVQSCLLIYF